MPSLNFLIKFKEPVMPFKLKVSGFIFLQVSIWLTIALFSNAYCQLIIPDSTTAITNKDSLSHHKNNHEIQVKFDYGGVLDAVEEEGIKKYYGVDIRFGWQQTHSNLYNTLYRAPTFGVGFYGGSFDNNDFGEPNALYGFIDIPFYHSKSRWSWIYGIGLGLAFNFNAYDPDTNPDNGLIGSDKNVYIALTLEGRYQITPHWEAGLGAGFKHFSNGRIQMPNSGINVVPVTFFTAYNFEDTKPLVDKSKIEEFIPFNMISLFGAAGVRNFEYGESSYLKTTLSISALRQFNYKYRYGLGFELFYTGGGSDRVTEDKSDFQKEFSYGFIGNWEWVVTERLYVPLGVGVYLNFNEENKESLFFKRIGARYLVGKQKKLFLGCSLKITETHADYVEWTLGYVFKKDPNTYKLLF